MSGRKWVRITADPVTDTQYKVNDLVEGSSDNQFRVRAVNSQGRVSDPSNTVGPFTACVTPGRPGAPVVTQVAADWMTILYQPPMDDGGSKVTEYIIEKLPNGQSEWTSW